MAVATSRTEIRGGVSSVIQIRLTGCPRSAASCAGMPSPEEAAMASSYGTAAVLGTAFPGAFEPMIRLQLNNVCYKLAQSVLARPRTFQALLLGLAEVHSDRVHGAGEPGSAEASGWKRAALGVLIL